MSERLGQVYLSREKGQQFIDIGLQQQAADYSNETAEAIDHEIGGIISKEYSRAIEILKSKKSLLEKGAALLLEKEKIEAPELKALVAASAQASV